MMEMIDKEIMMFLNLNKEKDLQKLLNKNDEDINMVGEEERDDRILKRILNEMIYFNLVVETRVDGGTMREDIGSERK